MRIAVALLALAAGCAHYVKLDPKTVTALQTVAGEDVASKRICARGELVEVVATTKDGKQIHEGGNGQLDEKHFDPGLVKLTASIGSFHERAWNPPNVAIDTLDKKVTITATLVADPSIMSTIELEPQWACEPPVAAVRGADGTSPGGNEGPGTAGHDGDPGGDAPSSTVSVGYIPHGSGKLVLVDIVTEGVGESVYILDPSITMRISAVGGNGGDGQDGQPGESRSNPNEVPTNGGHGANGANGGNGAAVTLQYDAASPELVNFVKIDVNAGAGGNPGHGGNAGADYVNTMHNLQPGGDGKGGRAGANGVVRPVAVPGLSSLLSKYAAGGKSPAVSAPPPVVAARPPGPPRPAGPPPKTYKQDDGARVYAGEARIEVSMPKASKQRRTGHLEVISTRTRKHHFTIELVDHCVLGFHRPDNEKRHIYELDRVTECSGGGATSTLKTGTLELDTANDTIALALAGSFATQCTRPGCTATVGALSYRLDAKRR